MKRRIIFLLLLVGLLISPLCWGITSNASDKIKITLIADNGTEEKKEIEISVGETFTVPECEFEAPEGLIFGCWKKGEENLLPGKELELTEDTEIHVCWSEPFTIDVDVYCGEKKGVGGTVSFPADGYEVNQGTSISETIRKNYGSGTIITAIPGNGYEFDRFEVDGKIVECETVEYLDNTKGYYITIDGKDYDGNKIGVRAYFTKDETTFGSANLNIELPVEGRAVRPVTVYPETGAKYSVKKSFWLCPDSEITPEPFKAGVNYRAHIVITPDEDGVVFSKESNITVNGEKPVDIWENEDGRSVTVITKNYKPKELIDTLEIFLNFPAISDTPNVADAWVKEGSPYKIYSAVWFNAVEQNGEEKNSEPASYVSGGSYFTEISLSPTGEFVFADTDKIKATVNGIPAKVEAVAENQIAVIPDPYIFGLAGTPYRLTVGNEAEWKPGDGAFEIVVKHESDATNHTFEKFNGVEVDGEKVDSSEYEASAGSVKIKFKESYLARLSTGEHKIVVLFNDGYMAGGTFTTNKADGKNVSPATRNVSPQTGDDSNLVFGFIILILSVFGIVMCIMGKKKKSKEYSTEEKIEE